MDVSPTTVNEAVDYARDAQNAEKFYRIPRVLKDVQVRHTKLGELEGDSGALTRLEKLEAELARVDNSHTAFNDIDPELAKDLFSKMEMVQECIRTLESEYNH